MADNKDKKVLNAPDKREQNDARIGSAEREGQVTKAQPKGNVPALRFPEFSGEWEHILNKELLNPVSEKNRDKTITLILSASQTEGMIERSNIGIDIKFDENSVKNYKIVRAGDYVVHLRSFQGGFAFSELTGICSPAYTILRPNKQLQYGFLRAYFMSKKFIDSLRLVTYGIRDGKSISVEEWMQLYTNIPSDKEQDKIIKLFNILDERITLQNKIIEKLETLIKGVVETVISIQEPNALIKDCLECNSSTLQESQVTGNGAYPVYGATGISGYTETAEENGEAILITKDGSGVGTVKFADGKYSYIGTLNRLIAREGYCLKYLYFALQGFCFEPYKTGMAIPHIYFKDYGNAKIYCPPLAEQKRIANVLGKLENKLFLERDILASFNLQKRYLLGQMFI